MAGVDAGEAFGRISLTGPCASGGGFFGRKAFAEGLVQGSCPGCLSDDGLFFFLQNNWREVEIERQDVHKDACLQHL